MEKEKSIPYVKTVIVIMIIQTIIIFMLIGMLNTKDSYSQEKIDYLVNKVNQLSTNEPFVIEQEIDYDKLAETILEKQPFAEKEFGEKFEEATSYFGEKAKDLANIINDKIQEKITEKGVETPTP